MYTLSFPMENDTLKKIYKESSELSKRGEEMPKVLISTIYGSIDPIMSIATKIGLDRIILVVDEKPDEKQTDTINLLKKSLGNVVDIKTIKTKLYDIVEVAEEVVKAIDLLTDKDMVYINITASKRPQALGLLFAAYTRVKKIVKVFYVTDDNKLISLPKLDYNLNNSQKTVLDFIEKNNVKNHTEFAEKIKLSKGMLYRTISELIDLGLMAQNEEEGFKLTDAGRIARL